MSKNESSEQSMSEEPSLEITITDRIDLSPSSRISPLYLELPDYSFYHSPLEPSIPDDRFIGRERVYRRFKSMVTKNKTHSGAYLITGYRGMGKSSFVKRLLSEIYHPSEDDSPSSSALYFDSVLPIYILWFIFFFIGTKLNWVHDNKTMTIIFDLISPVCFTLISFISLFWDYRSSGLHHDLKERMVKDDHSGFGRYLRKLFSSNTQDQSRTFQAAKRHLSACFLIGIFVLLNNIIESDKSSLWWRQGDLLIVVIYSVFLYIVGIVIFSILDRWIVINGVYKEMQRRHPNTQTFKLFSRTLHNYLFHHYNFVEVSLGFDSVSEREIYISIIRQMRYKISKFLLMNRFRTFRLLVVGLLLYISFHTPLVQSVMEQIRISQITLKYYPSLFDPGRFLDYDGFKGYRKHTAEFRVRQIGIWKGIFESSQSSFPNQLNYLNASPNLVSVQSNLKIGEGSAISKFLKRVLRFNSRVNIELGCVVSYYSRIMMSAPQNLDHYEAYFAITYWLWGLIIYCLGTWIYYSIVKRTDKIYCRLKELDLRSFAAFSSTKSNESSNASRYRVPFFSNHHTSVSYPIASSKDLETELLYILTLINQKAQHGRNPRYLIIIDEVDKIEPHENLTISSMAEETRINDSKGNSVNSEDVSRKRQQKVFALLSNLKHFFTTADAQFFFIAGQELFDASLADVADRNYFLGSVFHQVINIESLYSDQSDQQNSNITSMIEFYLAKLLIPSWYQAQVKREHDRKTMNTKEEASCPFTVDLSVYRKYLQEYFFSPIVKLSELKLDDSTLKQIIKYYKRMESLEVSNDSDIDLFVLDPSDAMLESKFNDNDREIYRSMIKRLRRNKLVARYIHNKALINKIITQLHAYTVYLAYRSNGAPKKVAALIDDNIYPHNALACHLNENDLIGASTNNLYLCLGYNIQYNINLINYLVSPLLFSSNTSIRYYGDKLLIGSSFIYDHLFKFHKTGFSLSDLDLMPEFIDINRAPEMRSMISRIIDALKENHLEEVQSGLYDFTFNRKLVEEINYLSKINDKEAAAFNFTLDESIRMKQYLYSKIEYLRNSNPVTVMKNLDSHPGQKANDSNHCTYSSHFLSSQLGDLHYYDDQFIDAEIQYKNSIMYIRQIKVKDMDFSQFINYIKTMLKIGLTYERMGNNDKALAYYEEASIAVMEYRDLDLSSFGMYEVYIELNESVDLGSNEEVKRELNRYNWSNEHLIDEFMVELRRNEQNRRNRVLVIPKNDNDATRIVNHSIRGIPPAIQGETVVGLSSSFTDMLLNAEFTPVSERALAKKSMFKNLQLFCLPLIAKLQIVERAYSGGIVLADLVRTMKEFEFVNKILRNSEAPLFQIEFYRKLSNILFFKNSSIIRCGSSGAQMGDSDPLIYNYVSKIKEIMFRDFPNNCSTAAFRECPEVNNQVANESQYPKLIENSCDSCHLYLYNILATLQCKQWKSMYGLGDNAITLDQIFEARSNPQRIRLVYRYISAILQESKKMLEITLWSSLAENLSFLSDVLLACNRNNHHSVFQSICLLGTKQMPQYSDEEVLCHFVSIETDDQYDLAIVGYLLSAQIFKKIGNHRSTGYNLKKILYSIQWNIVTYSTELDLFIKNYLIYSAIRCISASYGSIHRMEIQKIKHKLMENANISLAEINIKSITINADVQEYILAYENWKLSCLRSSLCMMIDGAESKIQNSDHRHHDVDPSSEHIKKMFHQYEVDIESWIINDHTRATTYLTHNQVLKLINCSLLDQLVYIMSLRVKPRALLGVLNIVDKKSVSNSDVYVEQIRLKAILDGLFSIHQAINYVNVNGITYKTNHSFSANLYYYMGYWCDRLRNFGTEIEKRRIKDNSVNSVIQESMEKELRLIFGGDYYHLVSPIYYYEKSKEHYQKAFNTHNQGDNYRQLINGMHFLHEDFGSDMYHFFAALDRRILNKKGYSRIDSIDHSIAPSTVYKADKYLNI